MCLGETRRFPALALLAIFAACSSKAAGGGNSDGGPDAPPDLAGDVAAAGDAAGGSDAHDAAGSDAGGSDGSSTVSPEKACHDVTTALCARRAFCGGQTSAGCADSYPCPSYYFAPDSRRNVDNLEACLPVLQQLPCTEALIGVLPDCLLGGTRQGGAPCAFGSQCASGSCSGGITACGTCAAVLEAGQACGSGQGICRAGSFCHRTTKVCSATSTIVHAGEGSPCDLAADPVVGCEGDLICNVTTSAQTAGTCVRPPGDGQPCAIAPGGTQICAAGLRCGIVTTSGARVLACGQNPCGTQQCPAGSFCYEDPMTPLNCRVYATEGQTCTQNMPGGDTMCASPTFCEVASDAGVGTPASGTCVRLTSLRPGDACDPAVGCNFPLLCTGGTCAGLDPATCTGSVDAAAGG
jgi:hypothetical protein